MSHGEIKTEVPVIYGDFIVLIDTTARGVDLSELTHLQSQLWQISLSRVVLDLSKLTHRQGLKRSFVGVGGLEGRGRQCLALTLACYLMVARLQSKAPKQS